MKRILIVLIFFSSHAPAQKMNSLGLQQANDLAKQNYPLIRQRELIRQTADINSSNFGKAFLPQLTISGQATYQSEVTQVKIPVTGITIAPLDKDQYRLLADVNQMIYDGGLIKQQKIIQQLNEEVEQQKIDVELFKIKERINQLFLGVLFIDEQLKQVGLLKVDLNNGIQKVQAQVNNGVAFKSNLNLLKAELLKTNQRSIELISDRNGLVNVLGLFINRDLPIDIQLETPIAIENLTNSDLHRPELQLFSSQQKLIQNQDKLIYSKNLPKASIFFQGGYGKPGLNLLQNEFNFFYTTGVRLNWWMGGLYTKKNEKQLLDVNKKIVAVQKDVFLLNTNTAIMQQLAEIEKLEKLITEDTAIIDLRVQVKMAASAQLENGVITANDFLREVNTEDQARLSLIVHQVQLLQAKINYQTVLGK